MRRPSLETLLMLALGAAALTWVATAHPGLRFVDFIGFAERAQRLRMGPQDPDWLNPLYPIGYPALLGLAQALTGDVLVAGKALAVLAALAAAGSSARLIRPAAAAWLLVQWGMLEWGTTEGTDLPALAFCLGALAAAEAGRPGLAGVLLGAGCLCRYTAVAALPAVLWRGSSAPRLLIAWALTLTPHWGVALALGRSPLPDQSQNFAIGAEGPVGWQEQLRRWPEGMFRALRVSVESWPARIGALGLLWGLWRKQAAAWRLALYGLTHAAGLGLAFGNPRLALPVTVVASLGLAFVVPGRWLWLPALGLGLWQLPDARHPSPQELQNGPIVELAAQLTPPILSSSPWFHRREEGWLYGAASLRSLGLNPATVTPEVLVTQAQQRGYRSLVLEPGRVVQGFPALRPMMEGRVTPNGVTRLAGRRGWVVYAVKDPIKAGD